MTKQHSHTKLVVATEVMIIAGEASGDMHGANLVKAMRQRDPSLVFSGVGGPSLKEQGVNVLFDSGKIAVVGIIEVFSHLSEILATIRGLSLYMRQNRPKLLILIDFPDFNMIMAKKANKLGIPVFYYVSPQVWAWRSGRVKTIGQRVDKLAVILPFEEKFYHARGVKHVEFVGHPLVDTVKSTINAADFRNSCGIPKGRKLIGLLPGSRKKEISSMLPDFLEAARQLQKSHSSLHFVLPIAPTLSIDDLNLPAGIEAELNLTVVQQNRYDMMAACDLVVAASGTVTLELAILGVPMVMAYRVSKMTYFLGRRLIKIDFASLVNLVAGKEVIGELLQDDLTPENIVTELEKIWPESANYYRMRSQLADVHAQLGKRGASDNAARLALEVMNTAKA